MNQTNLLLIDRQPEILILSASSKINLDTNNFGKLGFENKSPNLLYLVELIKIKSFSPNLIIFPLISSIELDEFPKISFNCLLVPITLYFKWVSLDIYCSHCFKILCGTTNKLVLI